MLESSEKFCLNRWVSIYTVNSFKMSIKLILTKVIIKQNDFQKNNQT